MSRFITFGLMILLTFAPAALAVDGTVLINQSTITNGLTGCPTGGHFPIVICQTGSYRLSGNLTVPDANTDAIDITADDVTIDLNGFSIVGPGSKGSGIGINATHPTINVFFAPSNISASNGTIRGMGSTGIAVVNTGRVYRIQAFANGADGIDAINGSLVSECISNNNGGTGISVLGRAMNNVVFENSGDGIQGSALVTGNDVFDNANGIFVTDGLVSGNSVSSNRKAGIKANCPVNIIGNHVSNNGSAFDTSGLGCVFVNNDVP